MYQKFTKQFTQTARNRRRTVRYSIIGANMALLVGVAFFVAGAADAPRASSNQANFSIGSHQDAAVGPLDQLSSVDIAVNIARTAGLAESVAVTNQSDSAKVSTAISSADNSVVAKPQVIADSAKSNKDIQSYTVQAGDTLASIAAKFNVTSQSIRWSNNMTKDTVTPGNKLTIPPVNGIVYTVKAGDSADSLAQHYGANKDKIVAFNDAEIAGLQAGQQIVIPDGQAPVTTSRSAFSVASGGFSFGGAAIYGYNGYDYGYCTWYVANKRIQIGHALPANLGDAWTWDDNARRAGIQVGNNPSVGAAVVTNTSRRPGHVAFVEAVNDDGSVWVSEMNSHGQVSMSNSAAAGGWGRIDFKLIPAGTASGLNYIH